jgi:hypothetical protein
MSELPVPPDPGAVEIVRAWLVGPALQCSIQTDAFAEPGDWGAVLADLARYMAEALAADGKPAAATLDAIRAAFLAELQAPSE